jgi:DNA modification methylase
VIAPVPSRLVLGDCLGAVARLPDASVDLAYADPPFFSGRTRRSAAGGAFRDCWGGDLAGYVAWLVARVEPLRRALKPSGSLYVHLDWRAVHHVKVALDDCFGRERFLNEIVWLYGLGGSSPRHWPRKHDTLLWYASEAGRQHFEAPRVPARSRRMAGKTKKAPDWWDIPAINNRARERLGWPTQKPEALLERIVASSCPPGGLVFDLFAGSGTAAVVAARLGRRFIACDTSSRAVAIAASRLRGAGVAFEEEVAPP